MPLCSSLALGRDGVAIRQIHRARGSPMGLWLAVAVLMWVIDLPGLDP